MLEERTPQLVFHIGHLADLFSKTPRLKKLAASDRSIKAVSECDDELEETGGHSIAPKTTSPNAASASP